MISKEVIKLIKSKKEPGARSLFIFNWILLLMFKYLKSRGYSKILGSSEKPISLISSYYVTSSYYFSFLNKFDVYILFDNTYPEAVRFKALFRSLYKKGLIMGDKFYLTYGLKRFVNSRALQKVLIDKLSEPLDKEFVTLFVFSLYFPLVYNYISNNDYEMLKNNIDLFDSSGDFDKVKSRIETVYYNLNKFFFIDLLNKGFKLEDSNASFLIENKVFYFKYLYKFLVKDLSKLLNL